MGWRMSPAFFIDPQTSRKDQRERIRHEIGEPVQELEGREILGTSRSMIEMRTLAAVENPPLPQPSIPAAVSASSSLVTRGPNTEQPSKRWTGRSGRRGTLMGSGA